jgi:hypothetical protein
VRLAIYERLYRFNFHLIEARRILEELGLALRIDEVDEFRRLRWELDEARREANRRCCRETEEAARRTGSTHEKLTPAKQSCTNPSNRQKQTRKASRIPGGHDEQTQTRT